MLNGQNFYGQAIKVVMERCPVNTVFLPKGLTEIGTGLGSCGKPLRNITQHYRRYITNQTASINREAFEEPPNPNENLVEDEFQVKKVDDFNYPVLKNDVRKATDLNYPGNKSFELNTEPKSVNNTPKTNVANVQIPKQLAPIPARSPMRQQGPQNFQPTNGPNVAQFGPRPGPLLSGHGPGPRMQGPFGPGPGPR